MSMRELVVVGDTCAYVGGVPAADFSDSADDARRLMDAFVARYRAAGWPVHDHRPARLPVAPSRPAIVEPALPAA